MLRDSEPDPDGAKTKRSDQGPTDNPVYDHDPPHGSEGKIDSAEPPMKASVRFRTNIGICGSYLGVAGLPNADDLAHLVPETKHNAGQMNVLPSPWQSLLRGPLIVLLPTKRSARGFTKGHTRGNEAPQ